MAWGGGGNATANLVWLCTTHHEGRLAIEGDADGPLVFTFPDDRRAASPPSNPRATQQLRTRGRVCRPEH